MKYSYDKDQLIVGSIKSAKFEFPEDSEWECHLFGGSGVYGFVWTPRKGEHPNWFWRKMQYLCFGFKWVKKNEY